MGQLWSLLFKANHSINQPTNFSQHNPQNNDVMEFENLLKPVPLALRNPYALETVFSYLDLKSLKSARLVSKFWTKEACRAFRSKIFIRHFPGAETEFGIVSQFITANSLAQDHALLISLLNFPWHSEGESYGDLSYQKLSPQEIYFQENSITYAKEITAVIKRMSDTGAILTELRLEMALVNELDAKLLVEMLTASPSLRRLALDFIRATDQACQAIPLDSFQCLQRLETFSFGVQYVEEIMDEVVCKESYLHLMKLFAQEKCIDALNSETNSLFSNLEGIRLYFPSPSPSRSLAFPGKLKIFNFRTNTNERNLMEFLALHSETLEILELALGRLCDNEDYERDLAKNVISFPALKCLNYKVYCHDDPDFFAELADPLNLRDALLAEQFGSKYPALTELAIVLVFPDKDKYFNYIFPEFTTNGSYVQINQLKYLGINFIGDCNSELVMRLHRQFPNLETLRHFKEETNKNEKGWWRTRKRHFAVCEHFLRKQGIHAERFSKHTQKFETEMDWIGMPSYFNILSDMSKLLFKYRSQHFFW